MKRAIIFYNGDLSKSKNAKQYIKKTDYIICADGGAEYAIKTGITPHVIIGDLDSLDESLQKKLKSKPIKWVTFPKEKNETDSELAVQHAVKEGYTSILIFGLFGSRLDHMLTNIFALSYLPEKADIMFIETNQEIRIIKDNIKLNGTPGDLVSLIPLKGDAKKVTTKNMQYPLNAEDLLFGYSRGISNVMLKKTAEVSIDSGQLLVIHTKQ